MKPTTQAKTTNQLVNQLEAMEQILASVIAGAKELGLNSYRDDRAYPYDQQEIRFEDALIALRKSLRLASSISVAKYTEEYRGRTRARNGKYRYLRTEYRARHTDCPIDKKWLLEMAAGQREAVQNTPELQTRIKAREEMDQQRENERKALQETL